MTSRLNGLMQTFALVGLAWAAFARPGLAADADSQFAIKGVGLLSCQQYAEARAAGSALSESFRNWLDGYLTAVNRYEPQTYDTAPWGSGEILAVIIDNHCRSNPGESYVAAVQKLVLTLHEDRLARSSPIRTVSVDGRTVQIYEDVLRRVQAALAERGLYAGAPDGVFGPRTQSAIATYQISEGLDGTGLPDPLTVWKLVRP